MNIAISCIRQTSSTHILRKTKVLRSIVQKSSSVPCLCRKYSQCLVKCESQSKIQVTKKNYSDNKGITPKKEDSEVSISVKDSIKESTKTTFNSLVIVAGISVTALLFYAIFRELFSSKSPNTIYTKAFDKCAQDSRIKDAFGEPIKGHGETTRRGRRRHVSHVYYLKDNVEHMRMKFYLKGSRKNGTVHLEVIDNSRGSYDFRYLFVQMDEWPYTVIVLEDNRHDQTPSSPIVTPLDVDTSKILT